MRKKASAVSTVIMVVMLVCVTLAVFPRLFGISIYTVSDSGMEPAYSKGDAVYVRSEDFENIRAGDVISFVRDEGLAVLTQKVYDVDRDNRYFITKNELDQANQSNTVMYENVLGAVKFSVPLLGYVFSFTNKTAGKITVVAVIAFFAALSIILDKGKSKKPDKPHSELNSQYDAEADRKTGGE